LKVWRASDFASLAGTASPTEVTIQVPERTVVEIDDAVALVLGKSRLGAIRLRSEQPFCLQSKTTDDVSLGPNGWFQRNLFELLGVADRTIDHAVEAAVAGPSGAKVAASLSRIDNRSGHGTFLAGVGQEPGR
jgi:hypothetical protein